MERVTLQKFSFSSVFGKQYESEFIKRRGVIKLSETEDEVYIAVTDGGDPGVYEYLEGFHFPKQVRFAAVERAEFASYIGESSGGEAVRTDGGQSGEAAFTLDTIAQDAPVINIINSLCIEAIRINASDIHIEAQADAVRVRYRVDGVLRTYKHLEKKLFPIISNRIKIMADMNTLERRLPQDGRMTVSTGQSVIDLRVSVIPTTNGESIVLRIFNKASRILSLNELGFSGGDLLCVRRAVSQPYGLVVLTGPTGSGKTTTLHALIETLPIDNLNIIALEDPVEQIIPGINQVQINEAIDLSFDTMLRRVLRQDPNVIMVGEIRDSATAELSVRSSLTGHLILTTLHTNDSISVIARLENMGVEPYLIAAVLRCSVAQRLVRKLCPDCMAESPPDEKTAKLLESYHIGAERVFTAAGCPKCGFSGYSGRTVISEVFNIDNEIESMITKRKPSMEIADYARGKGMIFMAEDALKKAAGGITTVREIEREITLS
jgi:general secretion pathway protein E/type IV pilus assembly protein PilB